MELPDLEKHHPYKNIFTTFTLAYHKDDNFQELKESTITDQEELNSTPVKRVNTVTKKVYSGDYETGKDNFRFGIDLYWFLKTNATVALHLNPYLETDFDNSTNLNLQTGILFGFQDKDKSVLNAELFYDLRELTKNNDEETVFERSSLGLRLTFPILFN